MGGSGEPRPPRSIREPSTRPDEPRPSVPPGADSPSGVGVGPGQELGESGRKDACPSDFPAEVTDIPQAMQEVAAGIAVDDVLPIELREGDPAFVLEGQLLGWLADNIEEVTECLRAGWRYHGIVVANQSGPTGAVITTRVLAEPPTA